MNEYENRNMNAGEDGENVGVDSENIADTVPSPEAAGTSIPQVGTDHISQSAREDTSAPAGNSVPVQPYDTDDGQKTMWSDPAYESATEDNGNMYTPGRYAYGAQNSHSEPPSPSEPPRRGRRHGFLRAVCLIIVCALAAGAATFGVMDYMLDNRDDSNGGTQVILGSSNSSTEGTGTDSQSTAHTGSVMTANEIYTMATNQVVGVNTSITTNIFGQTSTSAVSGTGFIISSDGYILTNYHVISYALSYDSELTVLMYDGSSYPATVVGYVEDNDVAVIKIDATGLDAVTLGNSDTMAVGDTVYAVGNPLGELTYTMTDGIVSALDRVITTTDELTGATSSINMFQTNAAVNSGNSGGPIYNAYGEVIGVVTAKYSESGVEGLSFAIPINDAVSLAKQLIENGYVSGAVIGVEVLDVDQVYSSFALQYYGYPQGVCVMSVTSGGAAEAAGLQPGDIITKLGSTEVESTDELKLALRKCNPGDQSTITVFRAGQTIGEGDYLTLDIVFDESAADDTSSTDQSGTNSSQQPNQGGQGSTWPSWGFGG